MQALSERLEERVGGAALAAVQPIGFSGLKTFDPPPESLVGRTLEGTGRRGKYLILDFGGPRVFVHLSQAGRLDVEEPWPVDRPTGSANQSDDCTFALFRVT